MTRLSYRQYQQRILVAMAAYTAFMLLVWPLVRSAPSLPLKVVLALVPLIPMFYVLALMARRIRDSDELEQRTHLIALSVATGITAALSLLGGFLAIAGVVPIDGSVLIWIFPLMMFSYGGTRWYVSRAYGGDVGCAGEGRLTRAAHFLLLGVITAVAAFYAWRHAWDSFRVGLLSGMAAAFLLGGVLMAIAGWRTRAQPHE